MHPIPPEIKAFALSQTVAAKRAGDADALAAAMKKLGADDPAFGAKPPRILADTPRELTRRLAAVQVAASVPIDPGQIDVLPCWTPARVIEAEHRLGSADGGSGDFAVVRLRIVPRQSGEGNLFESEFAGPPEIDAFNAAVARGVARCWVDGIKGEGRIIDTRVVFIDGAFHSTRSSPGSFEQAAAAAMRSACAGAGMRRLEPLALVEIEAHRDHVRPIVNDLATSGGSEVRRRLTPSGVVIVAELPMRTLLTYEARLDGLSGGRGRLLGEPTLARFAEIRRA